MALSFTITLAEPSDEFDIAKVHALAFDSDLITRVLFPRDSSHDGHAKWVLELFRRAEAEPDARCLKAVETTTGKIIGAAMLQTKPPQRARGSAGPFRCIQNQEFFNAYFPQAGPIYKQFYGNESHASWGSLVVHPEYQRRGVGTAMIRHGLQHLGMCHQSVDVNAMLSAQALYLRFGWKLLGKTEADLSEWCGKNQGFGLYQNAIMARDPGELPIGV